MADEHGSVEDIQSQFVSEAKQAPLLFSDLAKVELYIAETYRTRAFVELLQNADDARAKTFVISYENSKLVVANDGAVFSLNDLMALCRSGSSTKTRGAGTIGYRGIGFKSVVGIANEIDVVSGDYAFRFSKEMTKNSLNIDQDVPLIRIPHHIDNSDPSVKLARSFQQTHGVTTVFLMSGINQRIVEEEIRLFDETSVLFLNSVKTLNIDVPRLDKKIVRKSEKHAGLHIETIVSGEDRMSWIVAGQKNGCEKVAVKYSDNKIIASKAEESVIHAFLPTQEYSGGNLKLNGDFSTDPSRKTVDLDERSIRAFSVCTSLLSDMLREAVSNHSLSGIFSTLASNPNSSGRFREILRKELTACFRKKGFDIPGFDEVAPWDIRLAPDWIDYENYTALLSNYPHLDIELVKVHPDLPVFLQWVGARMLTIDEAIEKAEKSKVSTIGCAQLIAKCATQYRFDMTDERLKRMLVANILPTRKRRLSPEKYANEQLEDDFTTFLTASPAKDDIIYLFRKLNLPADFLQQKISSHEPQLICTKEHHAKPIPFKHAPAIKRWRSAEKNALEWLQSLRGVVQVRDVSKSNVGYDLEVLYQDGHQYQVEVKSVKDYRKEFTITNNEYSTASQSGDTYLIALIINSDPFEIRFIKNPIRSLKLEKRCERWSWICEEYAEHFEEIFQEMGEF